MIPDEAVRGHTPPPWFRALPGLERIRLWSEGALPWPPLSRLIGARTTHVVPGAVTVVIPASEALNTGRWCMNRNVAASPHSHDLYQAPIA